MKNSFYASVLLSLIFACDYEDPNPPSNSSINFPDDGIFVAPLLCQEDRSPGSPVYCQPCNRIDICGVQNLTTWEADILEILDPYDLLHIEDPWELVNEDLQPDGSLFEQIGTLDPDQNFIIFPVNPNLIGFEYVVEIENGSNVFVLEDDLVIHEDVAEYLGLSGTLITAGEYPVFQVSGDSKIAIVSVEPDLEPS